MWRAYTRDHPRLRGNNLLYNRFVGYELGSPPLTREQPARPQTAPTKHRITPAYAGTTCRATLVQRCRGDHPRLRGNNRFLSCPWGPCTGSPPLTREQLHEDHERVFPAGITPAYAGTTCIAFRGCDGLEDHPRLRGNNLLLLCRYAHRPGSPPLTREQL